MNKLREAAIVALEAFERDCEFHYNDRAWYTERQMLSEALQEHSWIGLTQQEFEEITQGLEDLEDCWRAIEQRLKEKNT